MIRSGQLPRDTGHDQSVQRFLAVVMPAGSFRQPADQLFPFHFALLLPFPLQTVSGERANIVTPPSIMDLRVLDVLGKTENLRAGEAANPVAEHRAGRALSPRARGRNLNAGGMPGVSPPARGWDPAPRAPVALLAR